MGDPACHCEIDELDDAPCWEPGHEGHGYWGADG